MTESLIDPRASTSFVIVTPAQMQALHMLLFMLIKNSIPHLPPNTPIDREYNEQISREKTEMHQLLKTFEGQ